MGTNLMSARRRNEVIEVAIRTVSEHLRGRELRARLRDLPAGTGPLVSAPSAGAHDRPDFGELACGRWVQPDAAA
jgi:hypothetical protein